MAEETNERGNTVMREFANADRYLYDFNICTPDKGWQQYDTEQDAWYFGVWVNVKERKVFTYCEGDCITITCRTAESFKAELDSMAEFYGPPPPAFTSIDTENGTVTYHYDKRPTAEG